jgi:RimJ/RimL family protein N-acetyltransferase
VEPVEINAGTYYLRAMHAGPGEIDDRKPVLDAFGDPELRRYVPDYEIGDLDDAARYIQGRLDQWAADARYSWAVAEPTTGEMLAEVGIKSLDPVAATGEIACWTHPAQRSRGVLSAVLPAVLRFGYGAVGLHHIGYRHSASNAASAALARKSGFTLDGTLREAARVDGSFEDLLHWSRLATDAG